MSPGIRCKHVIKMKRSKMKRSTPVLSIFLSLCLAMAMSSLAFADGSIDAVSQPNGSATEDAVESTLPVDDIAATTVENAASVDPGQSDKGISVDATTGEVTDAVADNPEGVQNVTDSAAAIDAAAQPEAANADAVEPVLETRGAAAPASGASGAPLTRGAPAAVPDGFIAGPNTLLKYRIYPDQSIDVRGMFNGQWISSTFDDGGFQPVVRSGETVAWGADDIARKFGLGVIATPSFSKDGKAIYLAYTIKNQQPQAGDTAPFVFDLAIIGDIQIGEDDDANVTLMDNGRGFVMVSETDVDEQGTPASLAIYYANTAGVDKPDTVWIGEYVHWHDGTYFTDHRQNTQGIDSAFAVSWQGLSLAPGAQMTRSIGCALGEMAEKALPEAEPTPVPAPAKTEPAPLRKAATATPQTVHQASLPQTSDGAVSLPVMMFISLLALGAATSLHVSRRLRSI